MNDIESLKKQSLDEVSAAATGSELEAVRIKYVGREAGIITGHLKSLKDLPSEEKRTMGPPLQAWRVQFEDALAQKLIALKQVSARPAIDLTKPGLRVEKGHAHPLTLVEREIRRIFSSMNFSVVDGPEMETEFFNFDALNVAPDHPARDMWDTFWVDQEKKNLSPKERLLLRTHTSPVQMRYMQSHKPPFQIIVPGRTFRYEASDAGHEINFYQVEGLMVGPDVTLANLKFVIEEFFSKFFAPEKVEFRYRPSFFPFVEPGIEVDVKIGGKWMEMGGAGMVHPKVFEFAHYNPSELQGFAFGFGMDRLAMIRHHIPDIRLFYSGDLRFIKQF